MTNRDEARALRNRIDELERELARHRRAPSAPPAPAILKVNGEVSPEPDDGIAFFPVVFAAPGGDEEEGAEVTFSAGTDEFTAGNLGLEIPPAGTYVIGELIAGLWMFRYDGPGA